MKLKTDLYCVCKTTLTCEVPARWFEMDEEAKMEYFIQNAEYIADVTDLSALDAMGLSVSDLEEVIPPVNKEDMI